MNFIAERVTCLIKAHTRNSTIGFIRILQRKD